MLSHIYQMLLLLPHGEHGEVYFDTPVKVLQPGIVPDINLWAACPTPDGDVMVMDVDHHWSTLNPQKDGVVIEAIFQRVRHMVTAQQTKAQEVTAL